MKTQLSSLEVRFLVKEFQCLIDGKIDKIYQSKKEFLLRFHVPGIGKKMIRILLPHFIFFSENRRENEELPEFCKILRKYLDNTRLRELRQIESERIIELVFETKDDKFRLIIELFSKGNVVLCKEDYTIILPFEIQNWKDRTVKPKEKYVIPMSKFNVFKMKEKELEEALNKTDKDSIVKALALDLGLGGRYSEELCINSGIVKSKKDLTPEDIKLLYKSMQKMFCKELKPCIYYSGEKQIDIVPFEMDSYSEFEKKTFPTFSEALDSEITPDLLFQNSEESKYLKEKERLAYVLESQKNTIKEIENSAGESEKKGLQIYENYPKISEILTQLKEARKKYPWDEIKKKTKGHKIIKDINEKEGKIILEF